MDKYTELFCSVLKAGLWGHHLDIRLGKEDFKHVWNDATRQVTRGLVGNVLVTSDAVPQGVADRIKDRLLLIGGENYKMARVLSKSLKILTDNGINPVLLKGHGVASNYREPSLRESGDIDLYVGVEDYRRAFDVLAPLSDPDGEFLFEAESKHSHIDINGIPVEIHRYCEVLPRRYNAFFQNLAGKGLSEGTELIDIADVDMKVRIPEPTFNAFFIFNHLWQHLVTEGVGLRQVCDWTMFLHANAGRIDEERLVSILEPLDLLRAWRVIGRVAVDVLGLPEEEMPLIADVSSKKVEKVVEMMMEEGNFGHEREDWWTVPRESFFDKVRVFFMILRRYLKLYPTFGKVVLHEYSDRMRRKFFS